MQTALEWLSTAHSQLIRVFRNANGHMLCDLTCVQHPAYWHLVAATGRMQCLHHIHATALCLFQSLLCQQHLQQIFYRLGELSHDHDLLCGATAYFCIAQPYCCSCAAQSSQIICLQVLKGIAQLNDSDNCQYNLNPLHAGSSAQCGMQRSESFQKTSCIVQPVDADLSAAEPRSWKDWCLKFLQLLTNHNI